MPTYDYVCEKCSHRFSAVMTFAEHEKKAKPGCPKCNSKKVRQIVTPFMAVTSKKS